MDIRELRPEEIRELFTVEYCPFCDSEQVIYQRGITACPKCGKPLAPCSVCETCVTPCPYGEDESKVISNPRIAKDDASWMYQFL